MNTSFILLLIFLFSSFSFIESSNLRKTEEIQELNTLLNGFNITYQFLQKELKSQRSTIKNILNLSFFKSLESTGKVKTYFYKEEKDFDSIINDIIALMGLSNQKESSMEEVFKNLIPRYKENNDLNNWMNFNVISTAKNDKDSISYGCFFVIFRDGKYHIIFCYGYGDFKITYNAVNACYLGTESDHKYLSTSVTSTYYSKELEFFNSQYIVFFMNLVGFKVFGNNYNIELPYPNLE